MFCSKTVQNRRCCGIYLKPNYRHLNSKDAVVFAPLLSLIFLMDQTIYTDKISFYEKELSKLKSKDLKFSAFRFSAIILAVLCFYFYLDSDLLFYLIGSIVLVVVFTQALLRHLKLRKKLKRTKLYIQLNKEELGYLQGIPYPNNKGNEFKDPEHIFANDLDLFGSNSLFQHLNRTISFKGRAILGERLKINSNSTDLDKNQEAVKELQAKLEWRQKFRVLGQEEEEESEVESQLKFWLQNTSQKPIISSKYILLPLAALCLGLLVNWFIFPSLANFNWFGYSFVFNLMVVFSQYKTIKAEYTQLTGISNSLGAYSELLEIIEGEVFESELLQNLKHKVITKDKKASKALKELSKILGGFDQLNNVVALFITNGLYHFHLHSLRRLFEWKSKNGNEIFDWIDAIAEFDFLSSLANYSFNNPEYIFPKPSEKEEFSALNVGHPLLKSKKRVDNSIDFNGFKYVLLTGSNMSGKSTFLRTLGLNLVLMKLGAPVCAKEFKAFPFVLLTSMKLVDSIEKEESYFQAEVIRLKRIHETLKGEKPCFVLLDEILRGTNSDDKRNGTRLFMEKIKAYNAKGVIATHDIDIADLAGESPDSFEAYYFESTVENDELKFDYKLREGVCRTPNATRLMQAQGII